MRFIGGIDPGLTGALAVLDFERYEIHIWDTPTYIVKVGDRERKRCDELAYRDALAAYPIDVCMVEKVQSTPNDGHVGAFTFGKVTGIAIGLIIGLDIELDETTPAKWKMAMRVPADKDDARHRASELFPLCQTVWNRVMDHGRSEAAIIALYLAISRGLQPEQPFKIGLVNGKPHVPKKPRKRKQR